MNETLKILSQIESDSKGVKTALKNLQNELIIQDLHKASLEKVRLLKNQNHLKIQLGCGPKFKQGWINIDIWGDDNLHLDIRETLPFSNDSASVIYSEHVIEHLEYPDEIVHLLKESRRILEPGGKFSLGVPDAEITLKQYANGELPGLIHKWSNDENLRWFPEWVWTSPMNVVNFVFRQGDEHKFAYDFETMLKLLEENGFVNIARRDFNCELDSEERRDGTLYVDGFKPL